LEITQYMRSTLLRDTDFMSMAHSLEVRVPFVDHVLLEQVLPLSGHLKLNGQPKRLLRQALQGLLPPEVLTHPKHTFTFPFERWLRRELASAVEAMIRNTVPHLSDWFEPTEVMRVWRDFQAGRTNWARPWALYVLVEWTHRYMI
ncbi:MAG: asparagine synthase-related protein, partial [Candidatus Hadarchaeum sp.]